MNDNLKIALDNIQTRIVLSTISDNILLIFDNQAELLKYRRKKKYMCPNEILITIDSLCNDKNILVDMRYKRFHFMRDEEINNE